MGFQFFGEHLRATKHLNLPPLILPVRITCCISEFTALNDLALAPASIRQPTAAALMTRRDFRSEVRYYIAHGNDPRAHPAP
jgi:hypothetical protein